MLFFINIKNRGTIKEYISATIKYNVNTASILTFTILQNSPFFNNLNKYIDKVEVVDFNNNKIFDGRVLNVEKSMNNKGEFINQVTCESVLNYLVDITVPIWNFYSGSVPQKAPSGSVGNATIQYVLQQVLNTYNEGALIKINLGNVTVNGNVTLKTNRQTCLQVITQALIKNFGGYIQIREENNEYYLDYLINPPILNTATNFAIGVNIQSLSISDSLSSMCTRLIGIGKTETLQAIAENESLIKTYGIIDKVIHFKDITDLSELQTRVNAEMTNINTDVLNASIGALDLSYINDDFNRLQLYQPITITCNELTYMQEHYIASITLDLLKPYSSTFQLNTNTVNQVPQLAQVIASNNETTKAILEVNGTLTNALDTVNKYEESLKDKTNNLELKYSENIKKNTNSIDSYAKICNQNDILMTTFNTNVETLNFYIIRNGAVIKVNDCPVLSQGVRDPASIYKNNKFFCAYSRWEPNTVGFGLSTSKDLINWDIHFIETPGYSRCWAPEFYEENGKMYVVFALCKNEAREKDKYGVDVLRFNMFYSEIDLETLTIGEMLPLNYNKISNKIDATLFMDNGILYNFVKNEYEKTIECYTGTSITGAFEYQYTLDFPRDVEGPSVLKQDDKYLLTFDLFSDGYSVIGESTDLKSWSNFKVLGDLALNGDFRISHGHMTLITDETAPIVNNLKIQTEDRFKPDTFLLFNNKEEGYNLRDYVKNNVLEVPEKDGIIFKVFAGDNIVINSTEFICRQVNSFRIAMLQTVQNNGSVVINDNSTFSLPNGNSLILDHQYAGQVITFTHTDGKYLSSVIDNSMYNNKVVQLESLCDENGYIETLNISNNTTYMLSSVKNIVINNAQYAKLQQEPIKIYFMIGQQSPDAKITINATEGSRIYIRNNWSINGADNGDKYFSFSRPYFTVWQDALRIDN